MPNNDNTPDVMFAMTPVPPETKSKSGVSRRGFGSMNKEKQREIASKGGKAAHAKGTAHEFTPDEARQAGRKGGLAVSKDRQHMAAIGGNGGKKSRPKKQS